MEPHRCLITRHPSAAKRRGLAHDEPRSPGAGIPQIVPRALVPELQVRSPWWKTSSTAPHFARTQPGLLSVERLATGLWSLTWRPELCVSLPGLEMAAKWGRAALPPLLPFNLEPDAHFGRALQRAQQPLPYEDLPVSDLDLKYVADAYAAPRPSLRAWTTSCGRFT